MCTMPVCASSLLPLISVKARSLALDADLEHWLALLVR